ncbi:hypothetical protein F5883DRAFT_415368 [Diaporthe sp. PMI_573]|nr:hypothetical protein F5883DRAFT_415368 [Diaporthaceae sp. PMI_573]
MAASLLNKTVLSSLSLNLVIILLLLSGTTAIQVTPGSPCASVCLDSPDGDSMRAAASSTNSSDIVCDDVDYFSSTNGQKFKDCITCLQSSKATSGEEDDVSWFLYNLRYASSVCLYDYPSHNKTTTTPCDLNSACAPLQGALEYGGLRPENGTEYGYCQAENGALDATGIDDCVTCLQSSSSAYVANFLLALEAGCREQPPPGTALRISGNIFSAFPINTTDEGNVTSSSAASSGGGDKPVLTTGATVGIALGAAALFLGAIALFVVYFLKQKKYEREDKAPAHPYGSAQKFYYKDPGSGPTSITTDHSYMLPQYTADYKPHVGAGASVSVSETPEPPPSDYSNNAEYYDRLEGKNRGRPLRSMTPPAQQPAVSHEQVDTIGQLPTNSLPTHPAYIPRTSSRNSSSRATPPPGARPGRNPTPSSPNSYAIQVYLNAAEDPKVPQPPPPGAGGGRATPAPSLQHISRTTSPDHTVDALSGGSPLPPPPRIGSLILPSVPRIRVPSSRKLPPRLEVPDDAGAGAGISGPLAFPGSRFSTRPPGPGAVQGQGQGQDRIIEQMVNRVGPGMEVPIGSGKSYLYG